jgi:probable HAF family extracellular repeat protein
MTTTIVKDGAALPLTGTVNNTGIIALDSTGDTTELAVGGNVTLQGNGQVSLSDFSENTIAGATPTAVLTNVNNTIYGSGQIDALTLVNQKKGVIDATGANSQLIINTASNTANDGTIETTGLAGLVTQSTTVSNAGAIAAYGPGALTIENSTIDSIAAGVIEAVAPGAQIDLENATINGGTVKTVAGSEVETVVGDSVINGATFNNTGSVVVNDGTELTVNGIINNTGTIALNSIGDATNLVVDGSLTLQGSGLVALSDRITNGVISNGAPATLTNVNNTISGSGTITDANLTLINQAKGVIEVTGDKNALTIRTGNNTIINNGTFAVSSGGTLFVDSAVFTSVTTGPSAGKATINSGTLEFGAASNLNVTFSNPTISDSGTTTPLSFSATGINDAGEIVGYVGTYAFGQLHGVIDNGGTLTTFDVTPGGITFAEGVNKSGQVVGGYRDVNNNSDITHGFLYSNGVFTTLDDPSSSSSTIAYGINDAGQIVGLYYGPNGTYYGFIDSNGTYTTLNDPASANQTVAVGINDAGEVVGMYYSQFNDPNSQMGFLYNINTGTYTNFTLPTHVTGMGINNLGQIVGGEGSSGFVGTVGAFTTVPFDAYAINDAGQIVGPDFLFSPTGNILKLDDAVQFTGTVSGFAAGDVIDLGDISSGPNTTLTYTGGTLTVTDGTNTANIKLSGKYTQSQFAMSSDGSGGTLITVSATNNPSGTPINNQVTWINGASGDWNTISDWSYKSNSGVVTGVLPAPTDVAAISATGTYTVTSPFDQTIESLTTIKTATLAVTGGTFTITDETGSGANAGTIAVSDGATLQVTGTLNNTGAVTLNSTGDITSLAIDGSLTLEGSGQVALSDNTHNFIVTNGAAATLTNVNDTIYGSGQLGGGALTLVNDAKGVIDANGTGNQLLISAGASGLTNLGTIETTGLAGLVIQGTVASNNGGTIAVYGPGALVIDNSTINSGGVEGLAPGAQIDLENATIDGSTVKIVGGSEIETTIGNSVVSGAVFNNAGTVAANAGTTLSVNGSIANTGTIAADGGGITISGNVTGSGQADIFSNSQMLFEGSATNSVTFENNAGDTGVLALAPTAALKGAVAGLYNDGTNSDTLDLQGINFASGVTWSFKENANGQQGILTVKDEIGDTAKITLLGQYLAAGASATSAHSELFQISSDNVTNTTGTLITTNFHHS